MKQAYNVTVIGKVQGVGFRYYTKKKADALSLAGNVMNKADGSVSIFVQGPKSDVDNFIHWCHTGPPTCLVDKLIFEASEIKDIDSFEIKR